MVEVDMVVIDLVVIVMVDLVERMVGAAIDIVAVDPLVTMLEAVEVVVIEIDPVHMIVNLVVNMGAAVHLPGGRIDGKYSSSV